MKFRHVIYVFMLLAALPGASFSADDPDSSSDSQETLKKLEKLEQRIEELENKGSETVKNITDSGEA